MSYRVTNPEDRFSCDKAHLNLDIKSLCGLYFPVSLAAFCVLNVNLMNLELLLLPKTSR